jgi:hypothetical protein
VGVRLPTCLGFRLDGRSAWTRRSEVGRFCRRGEQSLWWVLVPMGIAPWGKPHLQRMKATETSRLIVTAPPRDRSVFGGIVPRVRDYRDQGVTDVSSANKNRIAVSSRDRRDSGLLQQCSVLGSEIAADEDGTDAREGLAALPMPPTCCS